jgi:hypothetical protein
MLWARREDYAGLVEEDTARHRRRTFRRGFERVVIPLELSLVMKGIFDSIGSGERTQCAKSSQKVIDKRTVNLS